MRNFSAAIVGCGGIFPVHAQSLAAIGVRIAAICDINPDIAKEKAQEWGCASYTDYQSMIDDGGFDALHICLPHYLHAPTAIYALERRFHVLTEKPMAMSVADAEQMIKTAESNRVRLGVIFQNRYNPASRLIKQALDSGSLGKVRGGQVTVAWHRDAAYYTESGWRGRWNTEGGGVVINQSIHTFDLMNWLMGGNPVFMEASTANRAHPMIEVEDVAEGIIGYQDGVLVQFYVNTYNSLDAPVSLSLYCETGEVQITGERAVLRYHDGREVTADRDEESVLAMGLKDYWGVSHVKQISAFYEALEQGAEPEINGVAALQTQRLINGIYESAKSHKRIWFDQQNA